MIRYLQENFGSQQQSVRSFPDGVGVVGWMVPGGRAIAEKTAELMEKYDVVIWAHHGMFCSGEDFDLTFGLMHTVENHGDPCEDSFYDTKEDPDNHTGELP